jgi:competence protein ComGA
MNISKYFGNLMITAIQESIKDVYILPFGRKFVLKRHNGIRVVDSHKLDKDVAQKLINYCKYISGMSISEKRRPQMGSFQMKYLNSNFFLRFSFVGNFTDAESIVIRIIYPIDELNIRYHDTAKFDYLQTLSQKGGLILFAGKTGSGKTTSIYNLAQHIGNNKLVMTIEDPIEIVEDDFLQLEVNDYADMGYDNLIKVGLRNHPDIFIIGEIRDASTANAAIRASLSGHLVLSTIHARDNYGVVTRLKQLGCSIDELWSAITAVVYQKLTLNDVQQLSVDMHISTRQHLLKVSR